MISDLKETMFDVQQKKTALYEDLLSYYQRTLTESRKETLFWKVIAGLAIFALLLVVVAV